MALVCSAQSKIWTLVCTLGVGIALTVIIGSALGWFDWKGAAVSVPNSSHINHSASPTDHHDHDGTSYKINWAENKSTNVPNATTTSTTTRGGGGSKGMTAEIGLQPVQSDSKIAKKKMGWKAAAAAGMDNKSVRE